MNKKSIKKKSNLPIIVIIIAAIALFATIAAFINYNSITNNNYEEFITEETDASKFSQEYHSVSEDNVFVYRDVDQIIRIMEKGTGVVYLGFPDCQWCQAYVKYLNEAALETGIDKIYYFNIYEDRLNNTEKYQKIIALLSNNLQSDEEGNPRVYVPNISFYIDGNLIANDYESSKDTLGYDDPNNYWNNERITKLKDTLKKPMQQIIKVNDKCKTTCDN